MLNYLVLCEAFPLFYLYCILLIYPKTRQAVKPRKKSHFEVYLLTQKMSFSPHSHEINISKNETFLGVRFDFVSFMNDGICGGTSYPRYNLQMQQSSFSYHIVILQRKTESAHFFSVTQRDWQMSTHIHTGECVKYKSMLMPYSAAFILAPRQWQCIPLPLSISLQCVDLNVQLAQQDKTKQAEVEEYVSCYSHSQTSWYINAICYMLM